MGTRHLICVIKNGEPKVAQYGQWDGYPSDQGLGVLEFLRGLCNDTIPGGLETFSTKLDNCHFLEGDALEAAWPNSPWMSRDTGSDILDVVFKSDGPLPLRNSYAFGGDGLFCEYAYVIDLDSRALEVYSGFQKGDAPDGERFAGMAEPGKDYGPVRLTKSFSFDALPEEPAFLAAFAEEAEEEDA